MEKLRNINIPNSVEELHENAIVSCPKIKKFKCKHKFLNSIPKGQIVELEITDGVTYLIENTDFSDFKKLVLLKLPKDVTKLPAKIHEMCPKLSELNCS